MVLFGQIIGIVGMILAVLTYQMRTQKQLLAVQTAVAVAMVVHYFCLGAYSGAVLNIVATVRNLIYYDKKHFTGKKWVYIMTAVMAICGILSAESIWSFLIVAGLVINSYALSWESTQKIRTSILVSSPCVLIYDIIEFSIGGILLESFAIISSIVGIIRFRAKKAED